MDKNIGQLIVEHFLENDHDQIMNPMLTEWLAESPSNVFTFEEYKKIWIEVYNYTPITEFDAARAWEKVNKINRNKHTHRRRFKNVAYAISGIAASILLSFSLLFSGYLEKSSPYIVSTSTNYGNRSEVTLPDGTSVKLNAGTSITYVFNKQKNIREVNFRGEAFFDVAKNDIPFIINTPGNLQVKVLGTTFSISAYDEDQNIRTSLIEGSIELSDINTKRILVPGEIISYDRTTKDMKLVDEEISHTYGWMNNKLYMDNMSLSTVCKNLERWYDVQIILSAQLGESIHYTGVLQEESIIDILDALSSLSKIKYKISGRNISILPK